MEDGDSNIPFQDILENFDFEAFLHWDLPEDAAPSVDTQQHQVPALPTGKKRRPNGPTQPRIKRPRIQHSHICDIHEPPSSNPAVRCFGKRSRMGPHKGTRCERMVATIVEGELPVCAQHRTQVIKMTRCEALLECGFSCNDIVPWKPYGYPLCEAHWSKGNCYFLELPVEIRLLIYQYLIPDKPVPARRSGQQLLIMNRNPVYTAIFRANKTIHEEVADLFYGHTTFNIDVTNEQESNRTGIPNISMCNAKDESFAHSDYQLQLLLLQQQQRARAALFRTAPSHPIRQKRLATGIKHPFTAWQPALALRYFQRIRYLRINITFITPKKPLSASTNSQAAETILAEAERNLLCDYLHRMVEGLVTGSQAPLRNLDISIRVHGISEDDVAQAKSKAMVHYQALVKPIRRLRSHTANLVSLIRTGDGYKENNLLPVHSKADDQISRFVRDCCAELTAPPLTPPPKSAVLIRFGQLAYLVSQMCEHPFWRETDVEEIEILLSNGRSAREANDIKALIAVFRDVFDKLKKYNADHQEFMKQMKQSYEIMRSNGT